jgi:hypothetical protein
VAFSPGGDGGVSSSPERLEPQLPPITDELTSVLAFHGQHAFALGTAIALAERSWPHRWCWTSRPDLGERWPSRLVATAAEDRLSIKRNPHTSFAAASDCRTLAIYEYTP